MGLRRSQRQNVLVVGRLPGSTLSFEEEKKETVHPKRKSKSLCQVLNFSEEQQKASRVKMHLGKAPVQPSMAGHCSR